MGWVWIWILLAVCGCLLWSGLRRRGGIYEYPFLAGVTFLGFVLPQMPALAEDTHLPEGAFAHAAFFTTLCAAACGAGWAAGGRVLTGLRWTLDEGRVIRLAAVLSLVGGVFYYKLSTLPKDVLGETLYTGLPVVYLFFARSLFYGFCLAVLCLMHRPSKSALFVSMFGTAIFLHRVILAGRRGDMAELLLTLTLSAWFIRGIAIPRVLMLAGAILGTLALNSTGNYRTIAAGEDGPRWSEVSDIDVLGNFMDVLKNGGPEVRNAVMRISAAERLMAFDFGLFHWNVLVFNFVPAQLVGSTVKESLLVETPTPFERGYEPPTGSTETGMADAFASFWHLGWIKFFAISYVLARLYRTAVTGSLPAQVAYILTVVPAMLAITHHTQWVLSTWVQMAVFLLPGLLLTRVRAAYSSP